MVLRYRRKDYLANNSEYLGSSWVQGSGLDPNTFWCGIPYSKVCSDETHKRVKSKRTGIVRWQKGGPLTVKKVIITRTYSDNFTSSQGLYRWSGRLSCGALGANPSFGTEPSDGRNLAAIGATGIARFKPGRSTAGFGQAIAELRQIPTIPSLKKAVANAKGLGGEYLNVQFGWIPVVKDLLALINYAENLEKSLKQLRRDNGKVVRRGGTVDKTDSQTMSTNTGICGVYPILQTAHWANIPDAQRFTRTTVTKSWSRYWFKGAFRYYIPVSPGAPDFTAIKHQLLGLTPTPKLVWDLLPWTWLLDWFGNIGDIIDNMSQNAAQDLVMLYGYAMGTKGTIESHYASAATKAAGVQYTSVHREKVIKRRAKASPFGFDVDWPDFTSRQLAILAALGLSKGKSFG